MNAKKILISLIGLLGFILPQAIEAQVGVLNGLTHEKKVKPGETVEGVIILSNVGSEPKEVRAYPTDYFFTSDGKRFYDQPGKLGRSNADWLTFGPSQMTISPKGQAEIKFVVKVPADNKLAGTFWSVIMIEGVPEAMSKAASEDGKVNMGINQVMRFAVQIVMQIEETGTRDLKLLRTELRKENERQVLEIDIENIGQRWLRPALSAELYTEEGDFLGKYDGGRFRIFPGTSVRYSVDLSKIAKGKYKTLVILDNKDDFVFGAELNLEFPPPDRSADPIPPKK